jgi:succinate-acetate transporter protein
MSYATILIPGSGILSAFTDEEELASGLGIFLVAWTLVTFFLL